MQWLSRSLFPTLPKKQWLKLQSNSVHSQAKMVTQVANNVWSLMEPTMPSSRDRQCLVICILLRLAALLYLTKLTKELTEKSPATQSPAKWLVDHGLVKTMIKVPGLLGLDGGWMWCVSPSCTIQKWSPDYSSTQTRQGWSALAKNARKVSGTTSMTCWWHTACHTVTSASRLFIRTEMLLEIVQQTRWLVLQC